MLVNQTVLVSKALMHLGITTAPQQLTQSFAYGVQAVYSGTTISGTIEVQASIDHVEDPQGNVIFEGNWVTVTGSSQILSATGSGILNVGNATATYPWFRVVYIDSGSSNDAVMTITTYVRGM